MPNRQIVNGEPYRYSFQGQEKDAETGKVAFQLRLWDGRIGRWLTTDPAREFASPYLGMGNRPTVAIDPDGGDIIILNATKSVGGIGHAAILVGNDKDGWRYVSKNGTNKGISNVFNGLFGLWGKSVDPNLGNKPYDAVKNPSGDDFRNTGLTAREVIAIVNKRYYDKHNVSEPGSNEWYDRYNIIKTAPDSFQDEWAYNTAVNQSKSTYGVCGASCLDVPQDALNASRVNLKRAGDWNNSNILPNSWFTNFSFSNFGSFRAAPKPRTSRLVFDSPGAFDYDN
jgi:RHS repeat-associated protein